MTRIETIITQWYLILSIKRNMILYVAGHIQRIIRKMPVLIRNRRKTSLFYKRNKERNKEQG